MRNVFIQGYVAAAVWMWARWMNPWPVWYGAERASWHDGFDEALADRNAIRLIEPVLEPECARRTV